MHQFLFHIGDFPIRMYGLIICLSIFLATGTAYFLVKKDGQGLEEHVLDLGIYGGFAGLIGARLWDVFFFDWAYYSEHLLEIPYVWQGGMAIQGGIFAGVLTGIVYCIFHKIDFIHLLDVVTPSLLIGQSIGRMANLLNGDAFGVPTGSNFGLVYPQGTLAYKTFGATPLWPAEVWEGQIDIILFALILVFCTTKYKKGQVFPLYVILYSIERFFLEFLRGDYSEPVFLGFSSAQTTSLVFILIAAIVFIFLQFKPIQTIKPTKPTFKKQKKNFSK